MAREFIRFQNLGVLPFHLDLPALIKIRIYKIMRLKLSKTTRSKLPIAEDQAPLKTKENLEEYLQGAISFLQTQQIAPIQNSCTLFNSCWGYWESSS